MAVFDAALTLDALYCSCERAFQLSQKQDCATNSRSNSNRDCAQACIERRQIRVARCRSVKSASGGQAMRTASPIPRAGPPRGPQSGQLQVGAVRRKPGGHRFRGYRLLVCDTKGTRANLRDPLQHAELHATRRKGTCCVTIIAV